MGYTTFGKVLQWIEAPSAKKLKDNREDLVATANRIRQHFYLLYESVPLFLDAEECIDLKRFAVDCQRCDDTYLGFSLPRGMQTPEAAWHNRHPVKLFNKWREYRSGLRFDDSCRIEIYEVPGQFPTELDIQNDGCPTAIKLKVECEADVGRSAIIEYLDANGVHQEEIIELHRDYSATEGQALKVVQVTLDDQLQGGVKIAQMNGTIISEYGPDETVPAYRRFKVTGLKDGAQIVVRASRRFIPLFFDTDTVETDNRLAIEEMARYFRLNDSSDAELKQQASIHAQNAKKYLLGEKSRDLGKGAVSQFRFNQGPARGSGLRKNRLCKW